MANRKDTSAAMHNTYGGIGISIYIYNIYDYLSIMTVKVMLGTATGVRYNHKKILISSTSFLYSPASKINCFTFLATHI